MANTTFAASLRATLIDFLAPLREAAADPEAMVTWLASLGYTTAVSNDPSLKQIAGSVESIAQSLNALDDNALSGWSGVDAVLQAGRAIGSGQVEGKAKTLGLRMKRRGARWKKANVQPMASLTCVRYSSQWEPYWAMAA